MSSARSEVVEGGTPLDRDGARRPVLSSLVAPSDQVWNESVEVVAASEHPGSPAWLWAVLRRSGGRRAFILRGTSGWSEGYRELIAAGLLRRLRKDAVVVVSDATIEPGSRALGSRLPPVLAKALGGVSRAVIRFVDGDNVVWCVLSTREVEDFGRVWGLRRPTVVFTPFSHTIWKSALLRDVPTGEGFFSGGNSLRDYEMLIAAAEGLDVDVDVATTWSPGRSTGRVRFAPTSHEGFLEGMRTSRAVVLPLEHAVRSTGQQTYLNAMALGKVVIVNDAPGVRDHVEHGVTGLVVGGVEQMRSAMRDVLDPGRADHYDAMGRRAREHVLGRLTDRHYRARLLEVAGVAAASS
ncbi:glycosyltransferase [Kineococcus sp. SYSU DK002]|uniref:glycosyltransferase n=1 Tax=Kineococcus sp. SYSU DK002 TaxID=3383123 RepID=UPI003D7E6ABC